MTATADETVDDGAFSVHLDNFSGPFDLLLGLISQHRMDVTEVALSQVTDEFIAHLRRLDDPDLGRTTEFLLVAATLLDLKASRLLPATDVEDEEDLALLEARDLLFARLLQYRAFKQVAAGLARRLEAEADRHPRSVGLDPALAGLLPEVVLALGPEDLARIAARVLAPRPVPTVGLEHLHAPAVSVREQAVVVADRLRRARATTFRALTDDAPDVLTRVARFLALLELFRESLVAFEQMSPLGELHVRWVGADDGEVDVGTEFDVDQVGEPPPDEPHDTRSSTDA